MQRHFLRLGSVDAIPNLELLGYLPEHLFGHLFYALVPFVRLLAFFMAVRFFVTCLTVPALFVAVELAFLFLVGAEFFLHSWGAMALGHSFIVFIIILVLLKVGLPFVLGTVPLGEHLVLLLQSFSTSCRALDLLGVSVAAVEFFRLLASVLKVATLIPGVYPLF